MPRIKTVTAQGGPGVMPAVTVSPDSFGAQAGQGLTQLGRSLQAIGAKAQHVQDQVDLVNLSSQYEIQLEQAKNEIAQHPDIERHGEMLQDVTQTLQDKLLKANPGVSSSVQTAFQNHATAQYTTAAIDLAHAGMKVKVQRARADFATTEDRLIEQAALAPTLTDADKHLHLLDELRANVVRQGVFSQQEGQTSQESARDKYWTIIAQRDPNRILGLHADQLEAQAQGVMGNVAGMDPEKFNKYLNLAVSTLHTQQLGVDRAQKAQEDVIKQTQDTNARLTLANFIEGKPLTKSIAQMVRDREMDDKDGERLYNFGNARIQRPNIANYNPVVAATTEGSLTVHKYDNKPLDQTIWRTITDDYNQGLLSEPEHNRLMGIYDNVAAHKLEPAKAQRNQATTEAHSSLVLRMESANKLTGYSAIGNQSTANASQYFYQSLEENPNLNPWKVMEEAERQFKPLVEKQQGLSKTEQMLLDDAKSYANAHIGIISKAGAKALVSQEDRGAKIVNDAVKALPPPPPPGVYDWLKGFLPGKTEAKPRKPAGVMGGE